MFKFSIIMCCKDQWRPMDQFTFYVSNIKSKSKSNYQAFSTLLSPGHAPLPAVEVGCLTWVPHQSLFPLRHFLNTFYPSSYTFFSRPHCLPLFHLTLIAKRWINWGMSLMLTNSCFQSHSFQKIIYNGINLS